MDRLRPTVGNRKSPRLRGFDYSTPGAYFITICCADMQCLFGAVSEASVHLNACGQTAADLIRRIETHYDVAVGEFIVMPNHLHMILVYDWELFRESAAFTNRSLPLTDVSSKPAPELAVVVRLFKQAVTKAVRALVGDDTMQVLQRGYHEHVIRDEDDLLVRIRYIRENPQRWELKRKGGA